MTNFFTYLVGKMDPFSIFIDDLPPHLTYCEIKAAFWPFQTSSSLQICKKEKYLIITFTKEDTVQRVLQEKDRIRLKGHRVSIKQATKRPNYVQIPPSFFIPPEVLVPLMPPPPPILLLPPPPPAPAPQPPAPQPPQPPAPTYQHPFAEGFSYFFYK